MNIKTTLEWRKIDGFSHYEVTKNGDVRSLPRVMIRAALIAMIAAGPAMAAKPDLCAALTEIAQTGAIDGWNMSSIPDGLDAIWTATQVSSDGEARNISAAYLHGYAAGLAFTDPAEFAAVFYSACMSEGV